MMKGRKKQGLRFDHGCILAIILYFLLAGIIYYAAGDQLYERSSRNEIMSEPLEYATGEITAGYTVRQDFWCEMDALVDFQIYIAAFQRNNTGHLIIQLYDDSKDRRLYEDVVDVSMTKEGQVITCVLPERLEHLKGHMLSIEITSDDGVPGHSPGLWYNAAAWHKDRQLYLDGNPVSGMLCIDVHGLDWVWTGPHYWKIIIPAGFMFSIYCMYLICQYRAGRKSWIITFADVLQSYRFLMKQLVSRDFKNKYKRSVLGALWSFMNPLMLMSVQYFVFSTIFRSNIENYPVYLLSGTVLFNFFTESTNVSMYAITGNAGLIKKVYVPRYIYPVSKVLSTGINLSISLIPLLVMCLATGVRLTRAWLLIPYALVCMLVFCIGMGFILSAVMVFFRDVQFIWSVLCMVLTYATPLFYPESILPAGFRRVLYINPLYHIIQFFRVIVLQGISPQPREYLICALLASVFLGIGLLVFRRSENKFIFYI